MRSDRIKKGFERAPHRALLRATGLKEADFDKPFIAIVNSYVDVVPGHVHLQDFGRLVKAAVRKRGVCRLSSIPSVWMTASPWGMRDEIQLALPRADRRLC